jgi:hypothetical protein
MIAHLCAVCGRCNSTDIQDNDIWMKHPHDPNQPIEASHDQVEDGISLADAAEAACTPALIIAVACNLIFSTGMFLEGCREWRRRPAIDKTWTNFKMEFALVHQEFKEAQVTSNQAGCQSANAACNKMQQETALAPANLATATASDCSAIASLTAANSSLNSKVTQATVRLNEATQEISELRSKLANLKAATTNMSDDTAATVAAGAASATTRASAAAISCKARTSAWSWATIKLSWSDMLSRLQDRALAMIVSFKGLTVESRTDKCKLTRMQQIAQRKREGIILFRQQIDNEFADRVV